MNENQTPSNSDRVPGGENVTDAELDVGGIGDRLLQTVEKTLTEKGYGCIVGVDEAGRGPLAGPVVAAACFIPIGNAHRFKTIRDSKKMTEAQREIAFGELTCNADVIYAIEQRDAIFIDKSNILAATMNAMDAAVYAVLQQYLTPSACGGDQNVGNGNPSNLYNRAKINCDLGCDTNNDSCDTTYETTKVKDEMNYRINDQLIFSNEACDRSQLIETMKTNFNQFVSNRNVKFKVLIDGNRLPPALKTDARADAEAVVKGDSKIFCIAAASILAKVTRDRMMVEYAKMYPNFGFTRHKGYPTAQHQSLVLEHGPCAIHRLTFQPTLNYLLDGRVICPENRTMPDPSRQKRTGAYTKKNVQVKGNMKRRNSVAVVQKDTIGMKRRNSVTVVEKETIDAAGTPNHTRTLENFFNVVKPSRSSTEPGSTKQ